MKVAVLMSTYNGHGFLDKQLLSLANQTIHNDMIVYIRDDGSEDQTVSIIQSWQNKLNIVLYREDNIGPAKSFWELLTRSEIRADYYALCDQDDIWDSDKLEVAIKNLVGNIHLYSCNCRIIDEKDTVVSDVYRQKVPVINVPRLYITGVTQGCSMVFTDMLRSYIISQNIQCIPMHDIVLMLYALYYGKVYWDLEPHFGYRIHSSNVVAKKNKNVLKKIKTIYWNWKNSSLNSMADVAKEMLNNIKDLPDEEGRYLVCVAGYKKHKIRLLRMSQKYDIPASIMRSYVIRVLIGCY